MKFVLYSIVIVCFFVSQDAAAAKKSGFVEPQFNKLEEEVRGEYALAKIAQYLSLVREPERMFKEKDKKLKLYVAIEWFNQNHMKEAVALLDSFNPFQVYSDLWLYYRSIALIYNGETKKATPLIAKLEFIYPKDFDMLYLKSLYLAQAGDIEGAIDLLDALAKRHNRSGKVFMQRGMLQMVALSHEKAIKDFQKAIKYLPKHELYMRQQAYLQLGLIYWKIKLDQKKGRDFLKKGVEIDPNSELVLQVKRALQ